MIESQGSSANKNGEMVYATNWSDFLRETKTRRLKKKGYVEICGRYLHIWVYKSL